MTDGLDLRWVVETLADPPPEPSVLVQGLLRRGELCVLGAPRALGKSWWAMNLAALEMVDYVLIDEPASFEHLSQSNEHGNGRRPRGRRNAIPWCALNHRHTS